MKLPGSTRSSTGRAAVGGRSLEGAPPRVALVDNSCCRSPSCRLLRDPAAVVTASASAASLAAPHTTGHAHQPTLLSRRRSCRSRSGSDFSSSCVPFTKVARPPSRRATRRAYVVHERTRQAPLRVLKMLFTRSHHSQYAASPATRVSGHGFSHQYPFTTQPSFTCATRRGIPSSVAFPCFPNVAGSPWHTPQSRASGSGTRQVRDRAPSRNFV